MRNLILALLFLVACDAATPGMNTLPPPAPTVVTCAVGDQIPYVYHPDRLTVQAPCIVVVGRIEAVRGEADGDRHIMVRLEPQYQHYLNNGNIDHQNGDLVVEPVCFSAPRQADAIQPCANDTDPIKTLPALGDCVQMEGRYVEDTMHYNWAEIHPLGRWSASTACAAGARIRDALNFEDPSGD